MNIKIKESSENQLNNKYKQIQVSSENLGKYTSLEWSFVQVSGDGIVYHSEDALEGVFLNYIEPESPTINIKLPSFGEYEIKIVLKTTLVATKEVETYTIDDNGDPVLEVVSGEHPSQEYAESSTITLTYKEDDDWV